ncbi:hypothetical protein CEXT_628111 [Caerostris extrusa]|uniref:Uncharacterized protein n=1 Tax=Caerostris extrusa TaxID=172846 RepID=A0AAV4UQ67_CAEEX|nr:hypothetical protein CEXT_628111 [Caerostris extrusa]
MIQLQPLPVQYLCWGRGMAEDEERERGRLDRWEDSDSWRAVDVKRTLCFYFFTSPFRNLQTPFSIHTCFLRWELSKTDPSFPYGPQMSTPV